MYVCVAENAELLVFFYFFISCTFPLLTMKVIFFVSSVDCGTFPFLKYHLRKTIICEGKVQSIFPCLIN